MLKNKTMLHIDEKSFSNNKILEIRYHSVSSPEDLEDAEQELLLRAGAHLDQAYAPYSGYEVSAAILLENGEILVGTNQENAAYGLCLCAEQNVLSTAGSQFKEVAIKTIVVTARSRSKPVTYPVSPCGACRQVISDYEDRHHQPIKVILQGGEGEILIFNSIKDLLPFSFSDKDIR